MLLAESTIFIRASTIVAHVKRLSIAHQINKGSAGHLRAVPASVGHLKNNSSLPSFSFFLPPKIAN
jgi:hypothetical protein